MKNATAKSNWARIVEGFAQSSVRVGMWLATGLGILGLVVVQAADIFQLSLRPEMREGWMVVVSIAAFVSGAGALLVRRRHESNEKGADAVHRSSHK